MNFVLITSSFLATSKDKAFPVSAAAFQMNELSSPDEHS